MRIRRESSIGHQDVARRQFRMHLGHLRLVVRAQRPGQQLDHQARRRVEHGQQMRLRKTAARALLTGLAKVVLQLRRVGHREAAAIDKVRAMSPPARLAATALCRLRRSF